MKFYCKSPNLGLARGGTWLCLALRRNCTCESTCFCDAVGALLGAKSVPDEALKLHILAEGAIAPPVALSGGAEMSELLVARIVSIPKLRSLHCSSRTCLIGCGGGDRGGGVGRVGVSVAQGSASKASCSSSRSAAMGLWSKGRLTVTWELVEPRERHSTSLLFHPGNQRCQRAQSHLLNLPN